MDHFQYRDRVLFCEDVPMAELADKYGTPLFVYSQATLLHHLKQIQTAFASVDPIICYSVKTNGNINIGKLMADHGSGFDVTATANGATLFHAANQRPSLSARIEDGTTSAVREFVQFDDAGLETVPVDGQLVRTARDIGISFAAPR